MVLIELGMAEPVTRAEADPRLRVRAELSITVLTGMVETDVSVKSGLENAIDCPEFN